MTALSDALTAAQRSALSALEKAYVAGAIESEAMVAALESVGISDPVDTARSDRFAIWRMRWFPYRTYEYLGPRSYGPPQWQWPNVLRRSLRG